MRNADTIKQQLEDHSNIVVEVHAHGYSNSPVAVIKCFEETVTWSNQLKRHLRLIEDRRRTRREEAAINNQMCCVKTKTMDDTTQDNIELLGRALRNAGDDFRCVDQVDYTRLMSVFYRVLLRTFGQLRVDFGLRVVFTLLRLLVLH